MTGALPQIAATPLRLGFVGLGWIGRKRLDAIARHAHVQVAAVGDVDPARLQDAARAHPDAIAVDTVEQILDCDLDGVVIATPNGAHARQAIACLQRGVSVFCQKPLAIDGTATGRVVAAARAADRLLGVDFCYRHVQGMSALRERILAGALGQITHIDLKFHNAYGPDKAWCRDRVQSGGGCLLDLGVHLIDLARWLQGLPAMRVSSSHLYCDGRKLPTADAGVEDHACAELIQSNGAVVRLACSWNAHAGRDAVIGAEIFGTHGGAAWRNVNGSFFDFTVDMFHGTARERLGSYPDDWGTRALEAWVARLSLDPRFDCEAVQFAATAALIDGIYGL
jgi:predicted dehydrogenase